MEDFKTLLYRLFHEAAQKAFPEQAQPLAVEVAQSSQEQFGHYQMNSAMRWSRNLRKNPRQVAEELVAQLPQQEEGLPLFEKVEVAGPGFINCTLSVPLLQHRLEQIRKDPGHLGVQPAVKREKVIIDFSSPNTAKEMHVGHLRSTIIGDCLARLFEFLGHDVLRLNHVGDWGTAFGMLIAYMKQHVPAVLRGEQETDLTHLVDWYRAAKKKFDEDPAFKKASQLEVVSLQGGDPAARQAWSIICGISRKAYQEIYDLLGVHLEERGESFYNPYLPEIIQDLEKKGLLVDSEGAKCMFLEGFANREGKPLPLMLQKSDGGYNYATTDMATLRHRVREERGNHLIYVTDAGQHTHFEMIFSAGEKAGYVDRSQVQLDHVPFGLVLGSDGKKFRTRSGETERLKDLLTTAIDKAAAILREKNPDMSEKEVEKLASIIGIGSIKYADLSCHRVSDYTFSYDRMLRFEGNTAAFLLYAVVRIEGIKRKVGVPLEEIRDQKILLAHPTEIRLALHLLRFPEAIEAAAKELLPNRLTDYLYQLAETFHAFFRDCRVEGVPEQNSRLLLCGLTGQVLQKGLHLLGLRTVEKM